MNQAQHQENSGPDSAAQYYAESTATWVFRYQLMMVDKCGRRVYQKWLGTERHDEPVALLNYREFKKLVKEQGKNAYRWVDPVW